MCDQTRPLVATILIENSDAEGLLSEHGLSVHLSYGSQSILVDFGQSERFLHNAAALGIDMSAVDVAVLSHAHYDHADGLEAFCTFNHKAPVYLSAACAENCWSTKGGTTEPHYIGMRRGALGRCSSRLRRVAYKGVTTVLPGAYVLTHTTPGLAEVGRRTGMLVGDGQTWAPDDFAHEVSLVLELDSDTGSDPRRLVVVSSCSHAGCCAILNEVRAAFRGENIDAFIGGLHLVHATKAEVRAVAKCMREHGVRRLYTGHCTGQRALDILRHELPQMVVPMHPGLRLVW